MIKMKDKIEKLLLKLRKTQYEQQRNNNNRNINSM